MNLRCTTTLRRRPSGGFDPESVGAAASRRVQSVIEGILQDAEAEAKSLLEDARQRADRLILDE